MILQSKQIQQLVIVSSTPSSPLRPHPLVMVSHSSSRPQISSLGSQCRLVHSLSPSPNTCSRQPILPSPPRPSSKPQVSLNHDAPTRAIRSAHPSYSHLLHRSLRLSSAANWPPPSDLCLLRRAGLSIPAEGWTVRTELWRFFWGEGGVRVRVSCHGVCWWLLKGAWGR